MSALKAKHVGHAFPVDEDVVLEERGILTVRTAAIKRPFERIRNTPVRDLDVGHVRFQTVRRTPAAVQRDIGEFNGFGHGLISSQVNLA